MKRGWVKQRTEMEGIERYEERSKAEDKSERIFKIQYMFN